MEKLIKLLNISKNGKKLIKDVDFTVLFTFEENEVTAMIMHDSDIGNITIHITIHKNKSRDILDNSILYDNVDIKIQNKLIESLNYLKNRILKTNLFVLRGTARLTNKDII